MIEFLKKVITKSNNVRIGIINFIFWSLVLILIYSVFESNKSTVTGNSLYIPFRGSVEDTASADDIFSIITSGDLSIPENTNLNSVIKAINKAASDKKIENIIIDLDELVYVGMASAEEIGNSLELFKSNGKKVFAYSSFYDRGQYYLASFADAIYMDPFGEVNVDGLSIYRNYWKNAFDKFDVDVKVFRAGNFKSYVEPYISSEMSDGVKQQNLSWMDSIWQTFLSSIKIGRSLNNSIVYEYFNDRLSLMKKYKGDSSRLALDEGLVDFLSTRDEFYNKYYDLYHYQDYNSINKEWFGKPRVGLLNLTGVITYSDNSPGSISAINIEQVLDNALTQELDGLIVRINSGGGGVFASETIRRKLLQVKESLPVIISMGDVCASGGYWIATAGDKIYANKNTITGSIGVFSIILGFEKSLENNLGIITDGISTTPKLEPYSATNNISSESGDIIQLSVDHTYSNFLNLVSESRGIDLESLNSIAEGRVWSGLQALNNNLIDEIGGLSSAKDYFGKNLEIVNLEGETNIFSMILNSANTRLSESNFKILEKLSIFEKINDPKQTYALW